MRQITATVWCLATMLVLPAYATRDRQLEAQFAPQPVAEKLVPDSAKSDAGMPGRSPAWRWGSGMDPASAQSAAQPPEAAHAQALSPGQRQAGRVALGAAGGALLGALVPIVVSAAGGPIGLAIGLSMAPAGAAVGAVAGAAAGLAQESSSK